MMYRVLYTSPWAGFKLPTLVVIGTDCTCSCKSSYHMIMTTTTPIKMYNLPCLSNNLKEGTTWIRNSLKPCSCATGLSNKSVKKNNFNLYLVMRPLSPLTYAICLLYIYICVSQRVLIYYCYNSIHLVWERIYIGIAFYPFHFTIQTIQNELKMIRSWLSPLYQRVSEWKMYKLPINLLIWLTKCV